MKVSAGFCRCFGTADVTQNNSLARTSASIEEALRRARAEFLEMPGLRLTVAQAQRLWDLDQTVCETLLGVLTEAGFLRRTRDGTYGRVEAQR